MIENKAVLTGSMLVTFLSGAFVGHVGTEAPRVNPRDVEILFQKDFDAARDQGYDKDEVAEMRVIYQDYLKDYGVWWNQFLEAHQTSLDPIDERWMARMDALKLGFRKKRGSEPTPEKPGK